MTSNDRGSDANGTGTAVTPDVSEGSPLLVVGLGASAGGLNALREFFAAIPADSGLAFVVVTHQPADRSSFMAELLGRSTRMPVTQISTPTRITANHVYTAHPGCNLTVSNGVAVPAPTENPPAGMPVDVFFRSLARDQKQRAVGIVLSGTGSDGSLGVKEIKAELGMVMAQDEQSAQYDGMPHNAIATTVVDHVRSPSELAGELVDYARARQSGAVPDLTRERISSEQLQPILALVRDHTGHDFSRYKDNTIRRRIQRRLAVHHLDSLERYERHLRAHPSEIDHLFQDLLIGVTSFFRDPAAWEALSPALAELLADKPPDYVVRAWVPGCSTGEEAYSLGMLLCEKMDELTEPLGVQIFGTDIDAGAIETARAGAYPAGISNDLSPARLSRFFTSEDERYCIRKEIRDTIVFAPHDLVGDPPFTKLDLLSCRNLLIYLDASLQDKLVPIFHYALKPGGLLFLGSSESLGSWTNLFSPVDKRSRVFQRVEVPAGTYAADLPATIARPAVDERERPSGRAGRGRAPTFEQVVQRLLVDELVPPTVLVHERGDLVHVHGRTGLFLEPAPGSQSSPNVFSMAREGLQISLASAIREAATTAGDAVRRGVHVKSNGDSCTVDLRVRQVQEPQSLKGLFRVTFDARPAASSADGSEARPPEVPGRVTDLERALQLTRESHQTTIDELEAANQDLKSANEELQSANEELETSKEEMQSLNEELQTVNTELQGKVEELSRANDDMKNLFNSTEIATIFIDSELRIKRYTEQARKVIRLIPSDVGRPIEDLVSTLQYDKLADDARAVLRTLDSKEVQVRSDPGATYLMRIRPYRTMENVIDGLVITFVDVTRVQSLQEEQHRLLKALESSPANIFAQDDELRITWACSPMFGRQIDELTGKSDYDLFDRSDAEQLTTIKREVLATGATARHRLSLSTNGRARTYDLYVEPKRDGAGQVTGVSCVVVDVTWPQ